MSFLDKMFYLVDKKAPKVPFVTKDGVLSVVSNRSALGVFEMDTTSDPDLAKASLQNIYDNIQDKDFAERELKRIYRRIHALEVKGKTGLFTNSANKFSILNNKELMLLMPHLYSSSIDAELERVTLNINEKKYKGKKCVYVPIIKEGGLSAIERNNFVDVYIRPGTLDELDYTFEKMYDAFDKQLNSENKVLQLIRKTQLVSLYKDLINYQELKKDDDMGLVDHKIYSMLATMLQANVQLKKMPNLKIAENNVGVLETPSREDEKRIEETTEVCNKLLKVYGAQMQITPNFADGSVEIRNYDRFTEEKER